MEFILLLTLKNKYHYYTIEGKVLRSGEEKFK